MIKRKHFTPLLLFLAIIILINIASYHANINSTTPFIPQNYVDLQLVITTALIAVLGSVLINILPRYKWIVAALLLVVIIPISLIGVMEPINNLGISDWDYYFSYHHSLRNIILNFNSFPLWNPYTCGGTSGIGDPEFPVLTPTFVIELIAGIPLGIRINIIATTLIGALGMLMLAKQFKLSVLAAFLAAITVSLGSVNILELVEGHTNIFSVMWIPWIFWSYLKAYRYPKRINNWILLCATFLSLTLLQSGIYLLMYTIIALLMILIMSKNRIKAIITISLSGILALGLSAIKLFPVLLWLSQFQDKAYASSTYILPWLDKILLGRFLHGSENVFPGQVSGWHEYGAYIGIITLSLAIFSFTQIKKNRIILLLIISVALTLILSSSGPILKPIFDHASFLPRSNISRVILFSIISIALLAGIGMDILSRKIKFFKSWLAPIFIGLAIFELSSFSLALSHQIFALPPVTPLITPAPKPISYTINQHLYRLKGVDYSRAYGSAIAGYGTLSYCSVLGPPPSVRVIEDPEGSPYISSNKKIKTTLANWSPNKFTIIVDTQPNADITVNSNFAKGWTANNIPAHDFNGLLGTKINPQTKQIVFQYKAPGFKAGFIVTILSILTTIVSFILIRRH